MSKKGYTHIIALLDKSGSMESIKKDMIGGFNAFIEEQKNVEGKVTLTLAQFDTHFEYIHNNVELANVPSLTLNPGGSTALLDGLGTILSEERTRINSMNEEDQPEKTVCISITDGEENASIEYDRNRIFKMIEDLKSGNPKWDFVFMGANQDAIQAGGNIGIARSSSLTYTASSEGVTQAFCALSKSTKSYRMADVNADYSFAEEDREEDANKFKKAIPSYMTDLVEKKS